MARTVEEERSEQRQKNMAAQRKERIPLGGGRQKLAAPQARPGYVHRWINNDPGRIEQAQAAGYEFVRDPNAVKSGEEYQQENETSDIGSSVSRIVGKDDGGQGKRAYLMEIPKEFYDEDQAAKQQALDAVDAQIDKGKHENTIEPQYQRDDTKIVIDRPNKPT